MLFFFPERICQFFFFFNETSTIAPLRAGARSCDGLPHPPVRPPGGQEKGNARELGRGSSCTRDEPRRTPSVDARDA
jgi:hypothetical protein